MNLIFNKDICMSKFLAQFLWTEHVKYCPLSCAQKKPLQYIISICADQLPSPLQFSALLNSGMDLEF